MKKISLLKKITLRKVIGILRGLILKLFARSCGFPVTIHEKVRFIDGGKTIERGNWVTILWHPEIQENVKLGEKKISGNTVILEKM